MNKEFVCINCPMGCRLTVSDEGGELKVTGNTCPRGVTYGISEVTDPKRTLTALVRVEGRDRPLSVKTLSPLPKDRMLECAAAVKGIVVKAPVRIGDIVVNNLCGTGSDLAATENID